MGHSNHTKVKMGYRCDSCGYESSRYMLLCEMCGGTHIWRKVERTLFGFAILIALVFGYFFPK